VIGTVGTRKASRYKAFQLAQCAKFYRWRK
jgi:hypothetical protein